MNGVQCKVRVSNFTSKSFEFYMGLREGDRLSCLLFNIAMEGVIRGAGLDNDVRGTILHQSLQFLYFVDDIDIIGKITAKVCAAYTRLKRETSRIGLRINATKTKFLLVGDSDQLGSSVLVDGDNFEGIKQFCYLGTVVTSDNDLSKEIRKRFVQGNRTYYGFHRLLTSRRLQARTKCEIYCTLANRWFSMDTSLGPSERRMQTLWKCSLLFVICYLLIKIQRTASGPLEANSFTFIHYNIVTFRSFICHA